MRNVEYITNGFGGPGPIGQIYFPGNIENAGPSYAGPSGSRGIQYAPIETKIRSYLASVPVPQNIVEAAISTYNKFGPSGLQKTVQFVDAIEDAEGAFVRMFPNAISQIRGPMAGRFFKRALNSLLNTAASRIGLNPLSSALLTNLRNDLNRIPDSSTDPKSQLESGPFYFSSMKLWASGIANISENRYG